MKGDRNHLQTSPSLDGPTWRQGNGLRGFSRFLPLLVTWFCNIKAPCSVCPAPATTINPTHTRQHGCSLASPCKGWRCLGKCLWQAVPSLWSITPSYCASHPCANPSVLHAWLTHYFSHDSPLSCSSPKARTHPPLFSVPTARLSFPYSLNTLDLGL